jgi:hypothetical protein
LPADGKKLSIVASRNGLTGKMSPTSWIHRGASSTGMNTPDRNSTGRIVALTIAGAASALGMIDVHASASVQNAADPTATVVTNAGADRVGRSML